MRKSCALVLLVLFSWIGGLGQDAQAGVTIDVYFVDTTIPSGITVLPGDTAAPGCTFTGYYGRTVAAGRCMDVMLYTTDALVAVNVSVTYENDNGLAVASFNEWSSVGVSFDKIGNPVVSCAPHDGVTDSGSEVGKFDCSVPPSVGWPSMAPGTYRIGTIVWDTSAYVWDGIGFADVIAAYIDGLPGAFLAVRNGNIVDISSEVVLGVHVMKLIPEPSTAALLGLGLVGLVLTSRRRRG
jgi:hypothetical protein